MGTKVCSRQHSARESLVLGVTGIKRVHQPNPSVAEVGNVTHGDTQVMCQRGGCDEAVFDRLTRNRWIRIRFPETSPYPDKPAASQRDRHWFRIPADGKDIPRLPTSEWRSAAPAKPDPAS